MRPILREINLRWYLLALVIVSFFVAISNTPEAELIARELDPFRSSIGWQALYSFGRMFIAFALSLVFAISFGCLAATSSNRAKVILPVVDILQSVPLLGFFPTAIFWFMKLGPDYVGIELAVVFLIFTSQAWNLLFAVYDGVRAIPDTTLEASKGMGLGPVARFGRLYLPAALPRIIDNSALSWANGWYFLMACEIIALGPLSFEVNGLGSYMFKNIHTGDWFSFYQGLMVLFSVIVFMDVFVWRPLNALATVYRFNDSADEKDRGSFSEELLSFYRNHLAAAPLRFFLRGVWKVFRTLEGFFDQRYSPEDFHTRNKWHWLATFGNLLFWALTVIILSWSALQVSALLISKQSLSAWNITQSIFLSGLRILVAYLLCLAWILPLSYFLHRRPSYLRSAQSIAQILASIPATAFFPIIALFSFQLFESTEVAVILMLVTGMQWYLLFNVIGGAKGIGSDLKNLGRSLNLNRRLYVKKIFLPAIAPALITGSITAVGGGWNALIIAEYIGVGGTVYKVQGIGSIISEATFESGNKNLVAYSLFFMVFFIVTINKLFWQPLYDWAQEKYRMDET